MTCTEPSGRIACKRQTRAHAQPEVGEAEVEDGGEFAWTKGIGG
jgi:hypothetical protein